MNSFIFLKFLAQFASPLGVLAAGVITGAALRLFQWSRLGRLVTGVAIAQGRKAILYSDGVNLVTGIQQDAGRSAVSMPADADITLTVAQAAAGILEMTSGVALTATRVVNLPLGDGRILAVFNNTTGAQILTFKVTGQTGFNVANAKRCLLYWNATDVVRLTADNP